MQADMVLKAMAPEIPARYQRAGELQDVLAARGAARANAAVFGGRRRERGGDRRISTEGA